MLATKNRPRKREKTKGRKTEGRGEKVTIVVPMRGVAGGRNHIDIKLRAAGKYWCAGYNATGLDFSFGRVLPKDGSPSYGDQSLAIGDACTQILAGLQREINSAATSEQSRDYIRDVCKAVRSFRAKHEGAKACPGPGKSPAKARPSPAKAGICPKCNYPANKYTGAMCDAAAADSKALGGTQCKKCGWTIGTTCYCGKNGKNPDGVSIPLPDRRVCTVEIRHFQAGKLWYAQARLYRQKGEGEAFSIFPAAATSKSRDEAHYWALTAAMHALKHQRPAALKPADAMRAKRILQEHRANYAPAGKRDAVGDEQKAKTQDPRPKTPSTAVVPAGPQTLMPFEALSAVDRRRLATLEKVIDRNKEAFRELGEALAEIQAGRLYRETHETFEAYCRDRHGFGKSEAYDKIKAAEVAQVVAPIAARLKLAPPVEDHLKALAPVDDPADRKAIYETAAKKARKEGVVLTGKLLREERHRYESSPEDLEREAERRDAKRDGPGNGRSVTTAGASTSRLTRQPGFAGDPTEFAQALLGDDAKDVDVESYGIKPADPAAPLPKLNDVFAAIDRVCEYAASTINQYPHPQTRAAIADSLAGLVRAIRATVAAPQPVS